MLQQVYGKDSMPFSRVFDLHKRFKQSSEDRRADAKRERSSTSKNGAIIECKGCCSLPVHARGKNNQPACVQRDTASVFSEHFKQEGQKCGKTSFGSFITIMFSLPWHQESGRTRSKTISHCSKTTISTRSGFLRLFLFSKHSKKTSKNSF